MILTISEDEKDFYCMQIHLVHHFKVLSTLSKDFKVKFIEEIKPKVIVFNCKRFNEAELEIIKTVS